MMFDVLMIKDTPSAISAYVLPLIKPTRKVSNALSLHPERSHAQSRAWSIGAVAYNHLLVRLVRHAPVRPKVEGTVDHTRNHMCIRQRVANAPASRLRRLARSPSQFQQCIVGADIKVIRIHLK